MRIKTIIGVLIVIFVSLVTLKYIFHAPVLPKTTTQENHPNVQLQTAENFFQDILKNKPSAPSKLSHIEQQVNAKQAFDNKDWYGAKAGFIRIIADNPHDFQAWIFLCETLKAMAQDNPNNQPLLSDLASAKIKAREFASNDLDKALIEQIDNPIDDKVKTYLNSLLAIYPTTFTPYFLDIPQQTEVGTACITWTYPLLKNRNFHYENYIHLNPTVKDLGVIARGNKLCLEGLAFGENYQLTFKQGFRGEKEVKLSQDESLQLYIPHRKPSIRFRERGYILPSFGPQVVPFLAVNVPKVQVKIIHIPERNIQSVQSNWFTNQINPWEMNSLREEQGELVWEGVFHCENELNKTGISGLPIDKMLGKSLLPGVYIIEARVTKNSYDSNEFSSQALIISDIGLSTYQGTDGLHVFARDLLTAKPLPNVQLSLVAKNNKILASTTTNEQGFANVAPSLLNGPGGNGPAFITGAINGQQFTLLNLRTEGFDLSSHGSDGKEFNGPIEAYVFPERGIYRPGENVHLLSLLRQTNGDAQTNVPLTLRLTRPDGVLALNTVLNDKGDGSYELNYNINNTAPTGTWTCAVFLDPKGSDIGQTKFEVQDFVPPRIEVKSTSTTRSTSPKDHNIIDITAKYYFGPPAKDLNVEAESILTDAQNSMLKWQDYQFGLEEESWNPLRLSLAKTVTDNEGKAKVDAIVNIVPQTSHLLQLETTITVLEAGGRGRSVKQITPFWHLPFALGIKPRFHDKIAANNSKALFDLIAINLEGKLQAKSNLSYTLFAEQQDFIWFRSGNQWQYEVVTRDRVISNGKISLSDNAPSLLEIPVDSGLYRLEVSDETTPLSSLRFSAGWFYAKEAPDKPDLLELKFDKEKIFVKSPFAGELFLAVAGSNFKPVYTGTIGSEAKILDIPNLQSQLGSGGYLIGTVFRPANVKSSQMPARAIGVAWFRNEKAVENHHIELSISNPAVVKPNQTFDINIKVPDTHKQMSVSAALVDEGVLSLVDYTSPNPFEFFFAQRALGFAIRDSYGLLMDPFGARIGSFEEGGDAAAASFNKALSNLPAKNYKIVSLYSNIQNANNKNIISIPFTVPEFSGKLRLMVVAWDKKAMGSADSAITVSDDIDLYFVLPRFMTTDDKAQVPLIVRNINAKAGDYTLKLNIQNNTLEKKFNLQKDGEIRIPIDLHFNSLGTQSIKASLLGPDNFSLKRSWEISVRQKMQPIALTQFGVINPAQSYSIDSTALNNLQPQTSFLDLSIASLPDFGQLQLIKDLISYPYSCLEQTTSRMLATVLSPQVDKQAIHAAFSQLSSLQKIDGTFALWSALGRQEPWLTLYTWDVLQILQRQGIPAPEALTANLYPWVNDLQQSHQISLFAYSSYLTAKSGKGNLGTLRYFVDTHKDDIQLKQDLTFIAAAFAYYQEKSLAIEWFNKAILAPTHNKENNKNNDKIDQYGTDLRNSAILVALLAETTLDHPKLLEQATLLAAQANDSAYLSTQEKAWLIRAAHFLQENKNNYQIEIDQKTFQATSPYHQRYTFNALKNPIKLTNKGQSPVFYAINKNGEPQDLTQLKQQGFEVEREIFTLDGEKADTLQLKSGERYLVAIKGKRMNTDLRHVLLVDLLPAGFEIENANLINDPLIFIFPWLGELTSANRIEGRDDRFFSAFALDRQQNFSAAYLVRAVSKGTFYYPSTYVEAMYQPQNFKYGKDQVITIE